MNTKKVIAVVAVIVLLGAGIFLWTTGYLGRWVRGYRRLPELPHNEEARKKRHERYIDWISHVYGVDENNNGEIDTEEMRYRLMLPPGWDVENNTGGLDLSTGSVIFRFYGHNDIWGTVTKVDMSKLSKKDPKTLRRYYIRQQLNIAGFVKALDKDEYSMEVHKTPNTNWKLYDDDRTFTAYEAYSTEKFPEGKFATITTYECNFDYAYDDLGFVIKTYIPPEHLNQDTRTIAFLIGTNFVHYT